MKIRIIPGKMIFTQTREPIMGYVVEGSETEFLGLTIRKRSLPILGKDFQPTKERYERWEVVQGNRSWFFDSLYEAEQKVLELWRK